ncbi:MAG TPA: hypothetical protein DD706_14385 [Nitrospiraceae bacterium]|nr:hypothetical protein [Nitrospiraceae bacterium]
MHKINFFPLGNADCCRIDLECGKKILFDYADTRDIDDPEDLRWDLSNELQKDLKKCDRKYYDVVAFTHLDKDHLKGSSKFFYLEHSEKYQEENRVHIEVMWVPAGFITEPKPEDEDAWILQREARYRFKEKKGIRVFSRPERLAEWCEENEISLAERKSLITDAGKISPEFSIARDEVEFFIHSPFAMRQDENTVEDRNGDSIVVQATFAVGQVHTKALLMADSTHEALSEIVSVTKRKGNDARLEWDIVKLPHHCSYLSLGPEKGKEKTEPVENVAWLYENQVQQGGIIVSTSKPIPIKGSKEDEDPQPPHRQASNYYKDVLDEVNGQFIVTMENPSKAAPKPLVIEIGMDKATIKKRVTNAAHVAISRPAPRAG